MIFTVYEGSQPVSRHDCPDWEVNIASGGKPYVLGWAKENQYVIDSEFVDMPERPSDIHTWDWESLSWAKNLGLAEQNIKRERLKLLEATDWTQLPDVPEATRLKYQAYRQVLRDLTTQDGFPENVTFPEILN
jgi:hypothetical protein